ncbi:hypothetical protein [Gloeothece verrucosa]|uniref:Uncharacterized protein n=1 Tax=Gloeothece verrucosa (strain PCC 7822) TaxID=497965 RepID=E0UDQ3_GLOV7|nr:hypothetical protein [Gloeothece verrucosa]ADN16488.1 hypothetical protein Cyan7822_4579 [Gloeothece verrucosa PCC 7822]
MTEETMMIPVPKFAKGDAVRLVYQDGEKICLGAEAIIHKTIFDNDSKKWFYYTNCFISSLPENLLRPAPKGDETKFKRVLSID